MDGETLMGKLQEFKKT